jgi:hypothetical protein
VVLINRAIVLNRPLRPRAEGEQVWQPEEKISFLTPALPQPAAEGGRLR